MKIKGITGQRSVEVGSTDQLPTSVFITIGAMCIELDRGIFLHAMRKEFNLIEATKTITKSRDAYPRDDGQLPHSTRVRHRSLQPD